MGENKRAGGRQKGAQEHPEGSHGPKSQSHLANARKHGDGGAAGGESREAQSAEGGAGPQHDEEVIRGHGDPGKSRLFSDRVQHDDADLNSEKTRLARDADRHGHAGTDELSQRERQASAKRKS